MKVLFIAPLYDRVNGMSLASEALLDEVKKHNDVEIVNLRKIHLQDSRIIRIIHRTLEVLNLAWQVLKKKAGSNVIYITVSESFLGNLKDLLLFAICSKLVPKIVIHLHGGANMRRIMLGKNKLLRLINLYYLNRIAGIIILGPRHTEIYDDVYDKKKISIVPNFVHDELFITENKIEQKFENVKPLKILFLSNFLPGKGYRELIEAFKSLNEESRSMVEIDFGGEIKSKKSRYEFLEMIKGNPQIRYHGLVEGDKKKRILSQAHILCLPTYYAYEGQPITILEAYASGCAVVTTDHSGIFDIFKDGINGFAVSKKSPAAIKSVIENAIHASLPLKSIARNNYMLAQKKFRKQIYTQRLVEILESHSRDKKKFH